MASTLDEILADIAALQARFEAELASRQEQLRYSITNGRAIFDAETRAAHRATRERFLPFLRRARPLYILTAPVIYSLILPFVLLDLFVTLYQAICFPVYGLEKVRRAEHILIDRQYLAYLNLMQKLNCVYCSYCNGLISYVREIAARTEAHWCPIKHSRRVKGTHACHRDFVDYGDADGWAVRLAELRGRRRKEPRA